MSMQVTCSCGQKLELDDELAGQIVQCPTCQKKFTTPVPQRVTVGDGLGQKALLERMRSRAEQSLRFGIFALVLYIALGIIAGIIGQSGKGEPASPLVGIVFLLAVFAAVTLSILAIVFGVQGRKAENTRNRGSGTAGMILGIVGACLGACCLGLVGVGILAGIGQALGQ